MGLFTLCTFIYHFIRADLYKDLEKKSDNNLKNILSNNNVEILLQGKLNKNEFEYEKEVILFDEIYNIKKFQNYHTISINFLPKEIEKIKIYITIVLKKETTDTKEKCPLDCQHFFLDDFFIKQEDDEAEIGKFRDRKSEGIEHYI